MDDKEVSACSLTQDGDGDAHTYPQDEQDLGDTKNKARQLFRKLDRNSAQEACIESGRYNI